MTVRRNVVRGALWLALAASVAAPAGATTLARVGLEELVASNGSVVVGQVLDAHSYWNEAGNFILTDVRIATSEVLKGRAVAGGEITVTLMGGTVGETTTLIVAGAELIPGNSYVMFLNREDLPGKRALTVRDHVQGVFDIVDDLDGQRAVSQAKSHPLMPDLFGETQPPGGREGIALGAMLDEIRTIERSLRADRQEVK